MYQNYDLPFFSFEKKLQNQGFVQNISKTKLCSKSEKKISFSEFHFGREKTLEKKPNGVKKKPNGVTDLTAIIIGNYFSINIY